MVPLFDLRLFLSLFLTRDVHLTWKIAALVEHACNGNAVSEIFMTRVESNENLSRNFKHELSRPMLSVKTFWERFASPT